ncbi:MAG: penicillin-binding protein 2 [Bacteriovoracaceae bacterium]|jgi:penicillin-binding protein 2|nr:penicillin-binding protein 2 [Bacteriovoracaceae bacterium]
MFGDEELVNIHKNRAAQIAYIVMGCFFILLLRLAYLQLYKGELYHKFSLQNRLRKEIVRAPRGIIFDRNDYVMADNTPRFDVVLTRQFLTNRDKVLSRVSNILSIDIEDIEKQIKKKSFQAKYRPIIIKKNITRKELALIETENERLPGISVRTFISRDYQEKEIGAHLLGYISEINSTQLPKYRKRDDVDYNLGDFIGQFGLEQRQDKLLRGENGAEYVEVDALGRKKKYINTDNLFQGISDEKPRPGKNIRLTIDNDLQKTAFEALAGRSGSVVGLDINTGEVLAMVSTPSFDPSQFSKGLTTKYWNSLINNEENPLRDRNIQEHFPPGSTFKVFTAIAAMEEGIVNRWTKKQCHGMMEFNGRSYRSWKQSPVEQVNLEDALMQSCNIYFYDVATKLDIDIIAKYAKMFGLGKKTGINLPREVSGLIPTRSWKRKRFGSKWQDGETLSCSIGQSYVLVSTLQLATAYAAIANNGTLYKPYVVKDVLDKDGKLLSQTKPVVNSRITLKKTTWDTIKKGLYKVVNKPKGTAFWKRGAGNQMAGKSGTSQVIRAKSTKELYSKCSDRPYKYRHHGVFVAFAPYHNPKIAVASLVEHGCGGSSAAAPVVEKVISKYMEKNFPQEKEKWSKVEAKQLARYIKNKKEAQASSQVDEDE